MHRQRSVTTHGLAALAIAAAAALLLSGCSPGADYPSIFPALLDRPPPRADTPLDPDQVQQATEALITERNHLTAEAQGADQAKNSTSPAANPTTAPAAKKQSAAQRQTTAGSTNGTAPGNVQGVAADGTHTAGAETKP